MRKINNQQFTIPLLFLILLSGSLAKKVVIIPCVIASGSKAYNLKLIDKKEPFKVDYISGTNRTVIFNVCKNVEASVLE